MKPLWTSEIYRKFHLRSTIFKLRHKAGRSVINSHWQIHWQHIGESVKDADWKVGIVETCVASLRSRDDTRRQIWRLQIEVHGPKTSRAENQRFSLQTEKSRRWQTCKRSSEQRKNERKRQIKCREKRLHPRDHKRPGLIWRFVRIQAWHEKERQREGVTSFTFSDRFTLPKFEGDGKGSNDRSAEDTKKILITVRQEKRTDDLV